MKKETKLQQWGREQTKTVRIRADLHDMVKKESEATGKSMYYLINQAILEKYETNYPRRTPRKN